MISIIHPPLEDRATTVLRASHEPVFNFLADIENLPRWAGGFCERLYLGHGRWMALTSLGEMFVEVNSDAVIGRIVLAAGWTRHQRIRLKIQVTPDSDHVTHVKLSAAANGDTEQSRFYDAVKPDFLRLDERLIFSR